MSKSTRKTIRDVLIIICVIILGLLLYFVLTGNREKAGTIDLGDDMAGVQTPSEKRGMGHGIKVFPEDDDTVVAVVLGEEITRADLHRKTNFLLGRMAHGIDDFPEREKFEATAKLMAFSEILHEVLLHKKAGELGIDVVEIGEKVLAEWAKGWDSPEAKLAEIAEGGITVDDMRRLLARETLLDMIYNDITKEMDEPTEEERVGYFQNWLASELAGLEVEFADDELARMWAENAASAAEPVEPIHDEE